MASSAAHQLNHSIFLRKQRADGPQSRRSMPRLEPGDEVLHRQSRSLDPNLISHMYIISLLRSNARSPRMIHRYAVKFESGLYEAAMPVVDTTTLGQKSSTKHWAAYLLIPLDCRNVLKKTNKY